MLSLRDHAESLFKPAPSINHRLNPSSKPISVISANEQAANSLANGGKTEIVLTRNGYNELIVHLGVLGELKRYRGVPILVLG